MAILFPDRVRTVIADSTCMRFLPSMFHTVETDRTQRSLGQAAFWFDGHGRDWQDVVDADTEMFLKIKKELAHEGIWEVHQGRLSEIRCPVLFTCSLTDELIPKAGLQMLEMAAQVQNSQYFAANQGGHPLIWSCPQTFQSVVRGFLQLNDK
jgi:pimeloyl-ACP methyl ester carboxylesterase